MDDRAFHRSNSMDDDIFQVRNAMDDKAFHSNNAILNFVKLNPGMEFSIECNIRSMQYSVKISGMDRGIRYVFDKSFLEENLAFVLDEMSKRLEDIA